MSCEHDAEVMGSVARHKLLEMFGKSSAARIGESSELREIKKLLRFLTKHCTRSTYQLTFLKCSQANCGHCTAHPVRAIQAVGALR